MIKIGLLGTGFGKYHLEIYKKIEEFEVVKVFGRNEEKLKEIEKEFGVKVTTDIEEVINDIEIEMIDICLPTVLHSKYIKKSIESGKNVFCETPLSYSSKEVEELIELSEKYEKKIFVDLFYKFSTPHKYAIDLTKEKKLGKLINFKSYNKTSAVWGDLGLQKNITDFHTHNVDFILETIGVPTKLITQGVDLDKKSIVESIFKFEEKCKIAVVESFSNLPKNSPFIVGFELMYEKGLLRFYASYGEKTIEEFEIYYENGEKEEIDILFLDDYEEVIRHILSCKKNNKKSEYLDIRSAYKTIKIVEKMKDSISSDKMKKVIL